MSKLVCLISFILGFCASAEAQWILDYEFTNLNGGRLLQISVPDTSKIWCMTSDQFGYGKYLYKRVNGTWISVNADAVYPINSFYAYDSSRIVVNTSNKFIFYSSNSGQSWQQKLAVADTFTFLYFGIPARNSNIMYVFSYSILTEVCRFYKSTNLGTTWSNDSIYLPSNDMVSSVNIVDSNHVNLGISCWNGCADIRYLRTSNGGLNWTVSIFPNNTYTYVSEPYFARDNNTGLLAYDGFNTYLRRTTDGGLNWTSPFLFMTDPDYLWDIKNVDSTNIWYAASEKRIQKTTNNGIVWLNMSTSPQDTGKFNNIESIRIGSNVYSWTSSSDGRLFRLSEVVPFGIRQISNQLPNLFKLYEPYPNPFNPSTHIKFDLPKSSNITVKIFDITGRLAGEIFHGYLSAGQYEVTWDASNAASGVYFVALENASETKVGKLSLVK